MNLILLKAIEIKAGKAILKDRRLDHVRKVLKAKAGDFLRVGQVGGKLGKAEIITIDSKSVALKVMLSQKPPKSLNMSLCLALPRPLMLQRVLFMATQLGVKDIHLFHSKRVEKSFWKSSVLEKANIERLLREGLEQAVDTVIPQVTLHKQFLPFVEDELKGIAKKKTIYIADPRAKQACPQRIKEGAVLIIGPEGGFIDYELEKFKEVGAKAVQCGQRILRVETAVLALIGKMFEL